MKKLSAKPIYDQLLNLTPVVLTALMPVFFLPITTEFFEFNKQALFLVGTIVLLVAWALKILFGKKLEITRSVLDIPLLTFAGVALLATVFSINKASSIYGSTGRWFPSLLSYISLVLFYYLVSSGISSVKAMKNILNVLLASVTFNSIITILSYFGIYLGKASFLQIPNFTLTGSVTTSVVIAAIAAVIGASLMVFSHDNTKKKGAYLFSILLNVVLISLVNIWFSWIILVLGFVFMILILKPETLAQCKPGLTLVIIFAVLLGTLRNLPQTSGLLANANYPYEIVLPVKASWAITTSVIRDYPLLATGPSTFYLNFTRYRPLNLNETELWNIRFDKPFNELFNITSEMGLLGLVATVYVLLQLVQVVKQSAKAKKDNHIIHILGVGVATTTVVFFFTYATMLNAYIMVLLLALLVRSFHLEETFSGTSKTTTLPLTKVKKTVSVTGLEVETHKSSYLKFVIVVPVLLLAAYTGYIESRNYLAELFTRSSIYAAQNNNWDRVYKFQESAIKASPRKDSLYTRHAQTALILANSVAAKGNLTEEDKTLVQNLIAQSINVAKVASENINPLNVRTWETRALIYKNIAQAAQNATEWAIASYNIAIQLDPTNPRLRLDLGGVYYAKGDYLSAASQFRQAISLKSNYANAYYNFGQSLVQLGDFNNAKASLETARTLVPENSEDYVRVSQEIEAITKQISVAGAADQKPTVEQLQAQETPKEEVKQEPLNTVGEEEPTIGENITEETLVEEQN